MTAHAQARPRPLALEQRVDRFTARAMLWLERWERRLERQRQRRSLAALDDRALADIGVSRGEALSQARKPIWID